MLKEDPDRWQPVFKEIIEQTHLGAVATLAETTSVPTLEQARETALVFLEGGLVAGVFEGLASQALRVQESLRQDMRAIRSEVAEIEAKGGEQALESYIAEHQTRADSLCCQLDRQSEVDSYRGSLRSIFLEGFAVGTAEAAQEV